MSSKNKCVHIENLDETEIKRVKYILKKEGISLPEGMVFFLEDSEKKVNEIINILMAKTSQNRVHVYAIKKEQFQHDVMDEVINVMVHGTKETFEKISQFLISKRKGIYQRSIGGAKHYNIYTRKGNVEVRILVREIEKEKCRMTIGVRGLSEAVDMIIQEFKGELKFFM